MRTIVISDTHLTGYFEQKKFDYLIGIIGKSDRVIIDGDFWDEFYFSFDEFLESPWKSLFPYLKAKKTVYINGNHDRLKYTDERVKLFCDETLPFYITRAGKYTLHIEHGDRMAPAEDVYLPNFLFHKFLLSPFIFIREYVPIKLFGEKILKKYTRQNMKIKSWIRNNNISGSTIFVTGHTHLAEFSPEEHFVNIGFIRHGLANYLLIENGSFRLIKEKY